MTTTPSPDTECASKLVQFARENPKRTLAIAIGCGLAVGFFVRALRPHQPENRAARLLGEIQTRLHGIAAPIRREADHLVEGGVSAVRSGVGHFNDLHIELGLQKLGQRIRRFFR